VINTTLEIKLVVLVWEHLKRAYIEKNKQKLKDKNNIYSST